MENVVQRKTSREVFLAEVDAQVPHLVSSLRGQGPNNPPKEHPVDIAYYSAKKADAVTSFSQLFASDDAKVDGLRNVAQAKLDSNKYLLCNRVLLMSAVVGTGESVSDAVFAAPADDVLQGEIEITVGRRVILPKQPIQGLFANEKEKKDGVFFLDNPKFIMPDQEIIVRFYWPKALAAETCIKLGLAGTVNATY